MKLVPRVLAFGVALPVASLIGSVLLAGELFRRNLVEDVDRHLLAQAAIESVSLFDGPEGRPHVHLPRSPLADDVRDFVPDTMLIAPDGSVAMIVPEDGRAPPPERATEPGRPTLASKAPRLRTLTLGVLRPGVGVYTLYLSASLAPVEATMRSFYRTLGVTVGVVAALLVLLLYAQARALARRVDAMTGLVPAIRDGVLPSEAPLDGDDELSELHTVLSEVATLLYDRGLAQERFLANAAHQLRTPLAVLRTEVDLALRKPRDAEHLREALAMARSEIERLTLLARKLLDFESLRGRPLEVESVDATALVAEVVTRMDGPARAKGVHLVELGDGRTDLSCDAILVAQAVENVLENALRFAPRGSEIRITLRHEDDVWSCSVRDEGPGIPEAERPKVFEPFFRGSAPGAQTGLGLAFVAEVAERHGGRAYLGAPASGTELVLELPQRTVAR